jgi:hypothetical protein
MRLDYKETLVLTTHTHISYLKIQRPNACAINYGLEYMHASQQNANPAKNRPSFSPKWNNHSGCCCRNSFCKHKWDTSKKLLNSFFHSNVDTKTQARWSMLGSYWNERCENENNSTPHASLHLKFQTNSQSEFRVRYTRAHLTSGTAFQFRFA